MAEKARVANANILAADKPLEANPTNNPLELLLTGLVTTGPALKLANTLVPEALPMVGRMPWLPQAMARGATTGAAFGAVDPAASGQNPLPGAVMGAAAGAILGPAVEGAAGAVGRTLTRGSPPVSPVEPVETMLPARMPPKAPAPVAASMTEDAGPQTLLMRESFYSEPKHSFVPARGKAPISPVEPVETLPPARVPPKAPAPVAAKPAAPSVPFSAKELGATSLYHETDPTQAVWIATGIGPAARRGIQVSPDPALALGQTGKGATIEFGNTGQVAVRELTGKPGAAAYKAANGVAPEMEILSTPVHPDQVVKSITFQPGAKVSKSAMTLLKTQGWVKEATPEGGVKFSNPKFSEGAPPAAPDGLPGPRHVEAPVPGPVKLQNAQQFPLIEDFRAQVKADPAYAERIAKLGGGKVQTNAETLAKATELGPLHPDEVANWKAETPLNTVEQTRGLLTYDYFQQKLLNALKDNTPAEFDAADKAIRYMQPGIENLRQTGPRMTQAQSMFVHDEMGQVLKKFMDLRAKGVPFEQVSKVVNEELKRSAQRAKTAGLSKEVMNALDMIQTAATFAKLTSPVTHAVNTISNALTFTTVRPLEKLGTAGAYLAQGNTNAARGEVSTLFGTTMGFRGGMQRYLDVLMNDVAEGKAAEASGHGRNIPLPKALRPLDVFRQLSAADAFWKGVLRDARLNELAFRTTAEEGLSGAQQAAKIKALVADPPAAWNAEAERYAKEFTFQTDPDNVLAQFNKLQRIPGVRLFIPFMQTPYNIGKFQFERSPAGLLSRRNLMGLAEGGQAQAEAVGRLTAGLALSAGALALVNSAETTGDYPKDPRERERWKAEGIQPYSIRLPNGKWLAYNRFAPVGNYIGQAVAMKRAMEINDEKGAADAASYLMAQGVKQINDMPFLSGLSDALNALQDPERSAGRFAQGVATGFVPNILRDVRNQTDPTMRVARGAIPAMRNMIPGQSQNLEPQIDVFGRERTYEPSRIDRATKVILTRRESPESRLLSVVKWAPTAVGPDLSAKVRGKTQKVRLEGEEFTRYQREMGEATRQAVALYVGNKRFLALDNDEQVKRLTDTVNKARERVRNKWKVEKFGRGQ